MWRSAPTGRTPAYSPPEVIQGAPANVPADVYALGATLFALIAGSPPFATGDENLFSLLRRVAEDPVRDLRPDGVPDHVCTAIEQAMAKKPGDRPETAADLALALEPGETASVRHTTIDGLPEVRSFVYEKVKEYLTALTEAE